jgi:hypothetical protein
VRQKIQTSRDGPPAHGDLELSNVSDYGGSRHWSIARASNEIVGGGGASGAFAGVPDDFDHRFHVFRPLCFCVHFHSPQHQHLLVQFSLLLPFIFLQWGGFAHVRYF